MFILTSTDQLTGEVVPYIIENILNKGGKNVHVIDAITKKGRPEYLFLVDVDDEYLDEVGSYLLAEIGSVGFRVFDTGHIQLDYEILERKITVTNRANKIEVPLRTKVIKKQDSDFLSINVEYEDLKLLSEKLSERSINFPIMKLKGFIETEVIKEINKPAIYIEISI